MKLLLALLFSLSLHASEITIAVAANVSYAIDTLIAAFEKKNPGITVRVILGSSGKLTAQISHGAPYGLFMSANMDYPQYLYKNGVAKAPPEIYAKGALAMLSLKKRDISKGLALLADKKIRSIAIANPKTAPYGKLTVEALKNARIYNRVRDKFVYGESISQTVTYAVNAADVGIIAKSALYNSKMRSFKEGIHWKEVDSTLYAPIEQGIVLLNADDDYRHFYDFILSSEAQKIFQRYGYINL